MLNRQGLAQYYRIRETKPQKVASSSESYAYCDDPQFISALSGDGRSLDFFLEGIDCTACIWLLEKLPEFCEDAETARLKMGTSHLRVVRKPGASFASIARFLDQLGYRPHPVATETAATQLERAADHQDLVRIGVAAFATGNIMLLAVSVYAGADGIWAERFRWISALLAIPVLTFSAMPFYRSAWFALRNKTLNIDIPIMLAVLVGIAVSAHGLVSGAETLYFDSLAMLVLLLLSSRIWLKRMRRNYLDASDVDRQLLAGTVQKIDPNGLATEISALSVRSGDLISVPRGQFVPVDGSVVQSGRVQNAALTGESVSERRIAGDLIEAGAKVLSERLELRAKCDFGQSRLSRLLKDAEFDARNKPRWIQFSDRVAQTFVIVVLLLAGLTFAAFVSTDPGEGARRALALIIVTCPCVFGMAIPLSMSLAIREAARNGVIVKNADLFERLLTIKTVIFDKTGTLTEGDMHIVHAEGLSDAEAVSALFVLEQKQAHPIARAIREALLPLVARIPTVDRLAILPGGGVSGWINGQPWRAVPFDRGSASQNLESGVRLFCNNTLRIELFVEDRLKPGARESVDWFLSRGTAVKIFSGDHPSTVAICAKKLGLGASSEFAASRLSPDDKAKRIRDLGEGTLMVGDGANDAPALAAASVSIAVHGAMDASLKLADAYAMGTGLEGVQKLFNIADRTRLAIRRNLAFSAAFNVAAGTAAILGFMTPLWAAVLMPMSSLTVLAAALSAARKFDESKKEQG